MTNISILQTRTPSLEDYSEATNTTMPVSSMAVSEPVAIATSNSKRRHRHKSAGSLGQNPNTTCRRGGSGI